MPLHPNDHPTLVRIANATRHHVPPLPPDDGPPRRPARLGVFGTGTDWVQLTWSQLGPGPVTVTCGPRVETIVTDGGPGSHLVRQLEPATDHRIELTGEGMGAAKRVSIEATTLTPPPGEELFRLATVSDVHIGVSATGFFHTIAEIPTPAVHHTIRCLRAAQTEAAYWGAQQLVVKGDLVNHSDAQHWRVAGGVLRGLSIPRVAIPGNHERSGKGDTEAAVGASEADIPFVDDFDVVDRDGVRIVLADTSRPGINLGRIHHVADRVVEAAGSTDGAVFVVVHHQFMRSLVPTYIPVGIPRPSGHRFLRALGKANPRTLVSSGHTHRHRTFRHGGVTVSEVGSTKDFPGTWAGYQFYEGGVVQTVRRIGEPSVIRWTDHTRRAALGAWALWAPGPMRERCFSQTWPT